MKKVILPILFSLMMLPALAFGAVDAVAFKNMDADGDDKVSLQEYVQYRMRLFVRQDINKDQYLDRSENSNEWFFKNADSDGDGRVSFKEAVAQHFRVATRLDKDGDGFLSFEELNP